MYGSRHVVLLTLLLAAVPFAGAARANDCSFLPDAPAPVWVTQPNNTKEFLSAVGASSSGSRDSQSMLRNSLSAARKALAETIVSEVSSETVVELSKEEGISRESFRSVSTLESSLTLRGIDAEARWLDRPDCVLYTLVRIPKARADLLAVDAMLGAIVTRAADRSISYAMRRAAYDNALAILSRSAQLDFQSQDLTAATQLQGLTPAFERAETTHRSTEQQLADIRTGLKNAGKARQREAYRNLLDLASAVSFDRDIDTGAEPVYELMARTAQARGEQCNARRYGGDLARFSSFSYWQNVSQAILASAGDADVDCPLRLTELLGGREVDLYCHYRDGNKLRQWSRMCTELGEKLRDVRALAVVKKGSDFESLQSTLQPTTGAALVALADGSIEQQHGMGSGGAPGYRFSGQMMLRIVVDGEALFDDQFSGTTGWNPMSGDMVMDILAINLGKRLDKKLGD